MLKIIISVFPSRVLVLTNGNLSDVYISHHTYPLYNYLKIHYLWNVTLFLEGAEAPALNEHGHHTSTFKTSVWYNFGDFSTILCLFLPGYLVVLWILFYLHRIHAWAGSQVIHKIQSDTLTRANKTQEDLCNCLFFWEKLLHLIISKRPLA